MEKYTYKLCGLFPDQEAANAARERLSASGYPENQLFLLGAEDRAADRKLEPEREEVLDSTIKDLLAGAGIGAGVGTAGAATLAGAGVTLVLATPVLATLLAAGYGAAIGSIAGAGKALHVREADFAVMVKDAIRNGHWALIAHAKDEQEANQARELLAELATEKTLEYPKPNL